ncbi:xylanase [Bacteroides reticulotermitis JCM 10512]|uniref:Xylanase n=1 Tax=Bacteroides reticulotermitis JCM 10512 TaxID=1445607 RepID=W4URQ3_9BACE|nr:xylanase [Bacteroides reticulotermitis JCM 10512]
MTYFCTNTLRIYFMKNYKELIAVLALIGLNIQYGCSQPAVHYQIDRTAPLQTMEYFSASDAWSMQIIGLWPQDKQNRIADWLFSTENGTNGQPKGIGLSLWRFNVGAGSAAQGKASQIGSKWMRTECFLQPDGTYDWDKQQGQRNFLKLAKERGVNKFLAFLNSPPVYFTQNGLATNTGRGGTSNLREDCYDAYARFLADVVQGVEKHDAFVSITSLLSMNRTDIGTGLAPNRKVTRQRTGRLPVPFD